MQEFSVGDVVVLKSGGPDMTIMEIENGKATCWWMAWNAAESPLGRGPVDKYEFPLACLATAPPKVKDVPAPADDAGIGLRDC